MIRLPRWLGLHSTQPFEIHGFCDASEKAYAAVVYIRFKKENEYVTRLIISETRVAPFKVLTIPRLELCAAKLLMDVEVSILSTLGENVQQIYNWSDSQIVLHE